MCMPILTMTFPERHIYLHTNDHERVKIEATDLYVGNILYL